MNKNLLKKLYKYIINKNKSFYTNVRCYLRKADKMKLKGGIVLIGSLLWDNSEKRKSWRNKYFDKSIIKIPLPIRYGRISSSRMNTYTMVYSLNLEKEEHGQGIILEFNNKITDIKMLKEISENVIRVERDMTKDEWKYKKSGEPFTLNWKWGVLGLSINPKHKKGKSFSKKITPITKFWKKSLANFIPEKFSLKDEKLMIDKDGLFDINWTEKIYDLDFLISTIIVPNPENGEYPDENKIAKKMYDENYYSYFIKNFENEIKTKDDKKIIELLKSKYDISNYLKNLENNKLATN